MAAGISMVGILILLLLVAMVITGIVLIVMSRGRGTGYPSCGACGYDLSGTIGSERRCPECGADFATAGILPPTGKRRTGMLASGIVLLVLSIGCLGFGVLASLISYARASEARQQAVIQQQRAMNAATQAATTAALQQELQARASELAELTQRRRALQSGEAGITTEEAQAQLAELDSKIAELREKLDALREQYVKARSEPEETQTGDPGDGGDQ